MKLKSNQPKATAEHVVKDIRRATRRHYSTEDKIRIVLSGLRGEDSIAELCRKEGIAEAFATDDPFTALGYTEDEQTRSIAKWYARPCRVDNSYLISYESHGGAALAFAQFLADQFKLEVECDYTAPVGMKSGKFYANWSRPIYQYDAMGNRTRVYLGTKTNTKDSES